MKDERTALDMKNEYQREWYAKHPGKSAEYNRRYWEKKAAEHNAALRKEAQTDG